MEDFIDEFDEEFKDMSEGEKLLADALAHLLDRDTKDYVEFLKEEDGVSSNAAEPDTPYGDS